MAEAMPSVIIYLINSAFDGGYESCDEIYRTCCFTTNHQLPFEHAIVATPVALQLTAYSAYCPRIQLI